MQSDLFTRIKKYYCLLVLILVVSSTHAQPYVINNNNAQLVQHFQILADRNYSINDIVADSTLPFTPDSTLTNLKDIDTWWVRFAIENPRRYQQQYYLYIYPYIDDLLYFYDRNAHSWQGLRSGLVKNDGSRKYGYFPLTIENDTANIFYARLQVQSVAKYKIPVPVNLYLYKADKMNAAEQRNFIIWFSTLLIICMLLLYNLYTWFAFKDKAFLYYLLIVVGGMIYSTAINRHFNLLTNLRWFTVRLDKKGFIYFNDINSVLLNLGTLLVITGFIQFARSYLQTKVILPVYDKLLKYVNALFVIPVIASVLSNSGSGGQYAFLVYNIMNVFAIIIILLIVWVSIVAYRRKYIFGKYFLLANIIPLLLILLLGLYFTFHVHNGERETFLPNLAIISQTLTFAIALSARINILKKDLGNEQLQARSLLHHLKVAEQGNTEKEIVLKEIHHRVKNNLQIINGLLFMQFKDNNDEKMKAQLKQSQERIKSMALVHNKLYESDSNVHVYIKEYIKELAVDILRSNTPAGKSIQLNIEENEAVNLSLDTSVSLGLILNELITNACKYAFTGKDNGRIDISILKKENGYQLTVKDDGSGLANDFHQKNSMGLRLVNNLSKQLGGQATFENNGGTVVTINFVDMAAA